MVSAGTISEGHARALLGAEAAGQITALAEKVVSEGLNVRQTEALVRSVKEDKKPGKDGKQQKNRLAELDLIEEAGRNVFGTRVTLQGDENRGTIQIHYNSRKELERIYEILAVGQPRYYR